MANYRGAVRFADGEVLYFSYQGTSDTARRLLFTSPESVIHDQDFMPAARSASDEEAVEVIPYFDHGSHAPAFMSRASRSLINLRVKPRRSGRGQAKGEGRPEGGPAKRDAVTSKARRHSWIARRDEGLTPELRHVFVNV